MKEDKKVWTYKNIILDDNGKSVLVEGRPIYLRPMEFSLLKHLISRAQEVISRFDLLENVWGYTNIFTATNTVDSHICSLRKRLTKFCQARIVNLPKVGFVLR